MTAPAYSTALTPLGASEEWASAPRTRHRKLRFPLCEATIRMLVGSPTMQPSGRTPVSNISAIKRPTPANPTSSS